MNARDFSPIKHPSPMAHPPVTRLLTANLVLEPARVQPDYLAMDEVGQYAQTMPRHAVPADPDDVFSQDEDYDDAVRVRELLSQRPASTPNGKYVGIATDACAALFEIVQSCRLPQNYDQFSEVDVDKWAAICARMGYRP